MIRYAGLPETNPASILSPAMNGHSGYRWCNRVGIEFEVVAGKGWDNVSPKSAITETATRFMQPADTQNS